MFTRGQTKHLKNIIDITNIGKSKTLDLSYHNANGHKDHQGGDIPQGATTHKFA